MGLRARESSERQVARQYVWISDEAVEQLDN